jgi:hypothetical protein
LTLVTNDPSGARIPLPVEGRVDPLITVNPSSLFLGVVRPGEKVTKPIVVRSKKPFRVLAVTSDAQQLEIKQPASDTPQAFYIIPVTFIADEAHGKVERTIRITTDLSESTPELATIAYVKP